MKIVKCKDYAHMCELAAELFAEQIKNKPDSILGLATGSTPIGIYEILCNKVKNGELDFSKVTTFNLDEYYPIPKTDPNSYDYFMNENLYSKVNLKPENIHIPNGEAKDADAECKQYDEMIEKHGGIDLQLLGIGPNGHIGFNEPAEQLDSATHRTPLTEETIKANSRFFASEDDVPKAALTMGMGSILKAKKIVVAASATGKKEAVDQIFTGKITTSCPVTLLHGHADVTLFLY